MKNELHILTSYVGILLVSGSTYNNTGVLESVKEEIGRLKEVFFSSFNQAQERCQIREILNGSYLHLTELSDRLWESAREYNPVARSAMLLVGSLMDYMMKYYGGFLDEDNAITAFERYKLNNYVSTELNTIKKLLIAKKITEPLIDQIGKAFEDFFIVSKHTVISRADHKYIDEFLLQLSSLAHDQRDKDWNLRLRRLLIKYNFNHMGVYKFLEAEEELAIAILKEYEQRHDLLYQRSLMIMQVQEVPNLGYNVNSESLKVMLLKYMTITKAHLREKAEHSRFAAPPKFECNLSVHEISVEFRYDYEEGIFNYSSKREAADELIKHLESKATKYISAHSLTKFDKTLLYNAAINVYRRNQRKQNKLIKDFDIKPG